MHHLSGRIGIHTGCLRSRTGYFQLFIYYAESHVRHVVLHANFHSDEWSFYPYRQYARMGTNPHLPQPITILYGNHSHGITERPFFGRYYIAAAHSIRICHHSVLLGYIQLQEAGIISGTKE